ncbi:RrF2 family transcriptional regulator [Flavobacterium gawalongense]|uniref:Rrf2 family transcriptional regulator n=1 Tax=Flavobacterium gawalongense TaxID=2594432 RepID=A0A553BJ90_9FLAO|nr:Rrf2 family transcriptional regulator [Flavobacterium gawalongense]TRX03952.1 Rrf2 family transcriptional regulator [Flavobacterium gawalongense]TRX07129.1 Rrf2 family transcriptional regulator [Flavobacterium gawalongense]TRX08310.1 Rrf2 family transcriptional regulator [Flavobacterium gawalongense]TRX09010.1 Rrf2 family transcriptional regulator [Flavobacterium gawalongense]TRX25298.1 Rrf2 family transcriptional regulator [Flavobacterium gawalongense]
MLSHKAKYALKALLFLAQQDENHISRTIEIAEAANIPKKFLEQILLDLKRGHYVGSKQGKFGGYYLLKSKNDITLADIHRLFDGAIALLPCASLNFYEPCSDCTSESECLLRHGLMTIRDETLKAMQGITISSLVKK